VESQLQRHRQAVHHSSVDQSLGEGVLGIPERLLTLDICSPTGTLRVEDDWMDIDLACAVRNECNATRSPVRLHRVTMPAERLQQVFEIIGKRAQGKTCPAIDGIIEEGEEVMAEYKGTPALDAGLIAAAQAVEHYEITRYGTLMTWARRLGRPDCAAILAETLDEEKAADKKLTTIAEKQVNLKAAG